MDGVFRAVKKVLKGLDGDDEEGADPSASETFYDGLRGWNGSTSKLTNPSSDFQGDREWEALSPEERARTIRTYERMVAGLQVPLSGLLPRPEVVTAFLRKQNKERELKHYLSDVALYLLYGKRERPLKRGQPSVVLF